MKLNVLVLVAVFTYFTFQSCQHESFIDDFTEGNPEDSTMVSAEKPCDPDSIYFVNHVFPIIQSNCAFSGCHGNGSAQDGVNLTSYDLIINTADVRPFNLRGSDLYEVITETDSDKRMPRPPNSPLTAEQIKTIGTWIEQGALNNACDDCESTEVTFGDVIHPLIQNRCQGCHSGSTPSGNLRLTNYQEIQTVASNGRLFGAVSHASGFVAMPFNQPKLDQCKIDQVKAWIDAGALNN